MVVPGVEGLLAVVLAPVGRPPRLGHVVVGVDAQVVLVEREGLLPEHSRVRVVVGRAGVQGALLLLRRLVLALARTTPEAEDVAEAEASSTSSSSSRRFLLQGIEVVLDARRLHLEEVPLARSPARGPPAPRRRAPQLHPRDPGLEVV